MIFFPHLIANLWIVLNVFVYRSFHFTTAANVFFFIFKYLLAGFPYSHIKNLRICNQTRLNLNTVNKKKAVRVFYDNVLLE